MRAGIQLHPPPDSSTVRLSGMLLFKGKIIGRLNMTTHKSETKPENKTPEKLKVRAPRKSKTVSKIASENKYDNIEYASKPFDIQESGKNWPEGADFEEFYNAIQSGRQYPRKYGEK
jgi:hypothetical protein